MIDAALVTLLLWLRAKYGKVSHNLSPKLVRPRSRWSMLLLTIGMLSGIAHADFAKTIQVVPNVPVNAVTTWYYSNCTTSLGVGSYAINVAPKHGTLSFTTVSGPLPGCPAGSPSLPAAQADYTWTDTASGATSDYFQLYFELGGTVAEVIDVTVGLTQGASSARIFLSGVDVTGTTQTVVVGQQIPLTATVSAPSGATVKSQSWSVPGTLVQSYNAGSTGEPIVYVTADNLRSSAATFHWIDPATRQVTYNYTLSDGTSGSASVTFNILAPGPSDPALPLLTADLGTVDIVRFFPDKVLPRPPAKYSEAMVFGNLFFNQGITITPNLSPPAGYTGTVYLLQLGSSVRTEKDAAGKSTECDAAGFDQLYVGSEGDSPAVELPINLRYVSETMTAQTYLLWQPNLPHSIAVPLGVLPWGWNGIANRSRSNLLPIWTLESGSGTVSPFQGISQYPDEWTTTMRAINCY